MFSLFICIQFINAKGGVALARKREGMLSITNREREECSVWVVDFRGNIYFKTNLKPNEDLLLDIKQFAFGIYRMIFKTEHTSFIQEFVKY